MAKFKKTIVGILLSSVLAFAGTTGKISGLVTDADTGEPLPGANIYVQVGGQIMGAASDVDGYFVILNVPPGSYTVKAAYVGYTPVEINNVVVRIDLTTTLNIKMKQQLLEAETVVVEARRPIVVKDISNSQLNLEAKAIENMPITSINQALVLQAGIESSADGIIIRGSSPRQVLYMVDGLSMNDERSNTPYSFNSITAIEEIQVQTGGFNAEYGDLRAGLVNVVTKEGSTDRYTLSIFSNVRDIAFLGQAKKHFGPSLYSRDSYFNRPYFDPDVMWTGTNNGAWDDYTQRQYPKFQGWNAISYATLQDNDPSNDLTPEGAKRLFEWQRRRQGEIHEPDYVIDMSFNGPDPIMRLIPEWKNKYNPRFHLSFYKTKEMFVFPLSRSGYNEHQTQLKYTFNPTSSMKVILTGMYGEIFSVSPYQWTTTPTGRLLRSQSEVANLLSSTTGASILYMPGYYSPGDIYRTLVGAKISHALSSRTYYDASFQYKVSRYKTFQMAERDTSKKYEPVPGYFTDEAPYGYWGYAVAGIDGTSMGGWMNLGRDRSVISTYSFDFNLTSQVNSKNQIKTGLRFVYNIYDINSGTYSPSMSTWTRSMVYKVKPYRIGFYVQDKLEYEGFIANIGVRLDYSDPDVEWYDLSPYDPFLKAGYGDLIEEEAPRKNAKPQFAVSPRLGVSHPISENAKLYFNYGHFRTEPASSYRFRLQRESNGLVTYLGNPELRYEKTVAYELGYEHNLFDMFLLKIAGYYKDISNQPSWVYYRNINGSVSYYKMSDLNYQDIRGIEFTLTKRYGRWLTGFVNYTYDVQTSGYFGYLRYYEDPNEQRQYLRENPYQSKPRPQPYARVNLSFRTPSDFGPKFGPIGLLSDFDLNLLAVYREGSYYTFNPFNKPGVLYNTQWRDYYNVDLRFSKKFTIKTENHNFDIQFFMDVRNLFNFKYMSYAGFSDNHDFIDYMNSLRFSWETGDEKGNDRIGDYRPVGVAYDPLEPNPNNDPEIAARNKKRIESKSYIDMPNIKALTFLNPRDIFWGIRLNFNLGIVK
ncbi:TonB-dependent receptor [Calditrichota bacterium LG25]